MRRVVVVGGGAAGALAALHLLSVGGGRLETVVCEPADTLGRGIAYSTVDPLHRLNVPAGQMSAFPDSPEDFVRWSSADAADFAPRGDYGRYLAERLASQAGAAPGRLSHLRVRVRRVSQNRGAGRPWVVHTSGRGDEHLVSADAVILAVGNPPSKMPAAVAPLVGSPCLIPEPWAPGALSAVRHNEQVLVVGTGLTFVDVALSLTSISGTRVTGLSRHGLLPETHRPLRTVPAAPDLDSPLEVLRWIRSQGDGWREAFAALRPVTSRLWVTLGADGQRQFLRHALRHWETRRHRVAPAVWQGLLSLLQEGRVRLSAGQIAETSVDGSGRALVTVTTKMGTGTSTASTVYDRVVLCTGASDEAFLRMDPVAGLLADGLAVAGPHKMGIDVEVDSGAVLDANGRPVTGLYALGPIRRGAQWETTAIPEIRAQAAAIARRCAD